MAIVVERKPEAEMENYFYYELTPYPTSLLKDGAMRTLRNKAELKNYLVQGNIISEGSDCIRVAYGEVLLWSCNWSKNDNFSKIFQKYIDKCLMEKFDVIVFDGYIFSTKSITCKSRSVRISQTVEIDESYMCTIDRNELLTNYTNKENFVTALTAKLKANGIKVVLCPSDADTTIAKSAMEYENRAVTIFADDTDTLSSLALFIQLKRSW